MAPPVREGVSEGRESEKGGEPANARHDLGADARAEEDAGADDAQPMRVCVLRECAGCGCRVQQAAGSKGQKERRDWGVTLRGPNE